MEKKSTVKPKNVFGSNELGKIINQNSDKDMLMTFVQVSKKCQLSAAIVEVKSQMISQHQNSKTDDQNPQIQPTEEERRKEETPKKFQQSPKRENSENVINNKQNEQQLKRILLTGNELDEYFDAYVKLQDIEKETIF